MSAAAVPSYRAVWRRAVRLCASQMTRSRSWKVAIVLAFAASAFFAGCGLYLGLEGHGFELGGVQSRAAMIIGWIIGAILGLWCAADRAGKDRIEGVVALARIHGIRRETLGRARPIAFSLAISALSLAGCLPVWLTSVAAAPSVTAALERAASVVLLAAFAAGVGVTSGALGSACGRLAPRRGRTLFAALVLVPWSLDGIGSAAHASFRSIPGLLGLLARLMADLGVGA